MSLAVLSNININPLKEYLPKDAVKKVRFCEYGHHLLDLINDGSFLYNKDVETIFLHLDGEELLKDEFFSVSLDQNKVAGEINQIINAVENLINKKSGVTVIISSLVFPPLSFIPYLRNRNIISLNEIGGKVNRILKNFSLRFPNVLLLDFERMVRLIGYQEIFDDKYWFLGKIKYNEIGFKIIAEEFNNIINGYRGRIKKVLVVDLDNVLWGGVIGEDGIGGIELSEDGIGKAYRDFQKILKAIKQLGVILAINSKNNENDVKAAFEKCPLMVLQYSDFVVRKINWNDKVTNMKDIARELGLSLDSFVFIDDSPVERAAIRKHLGDVEVPDFPEDIAQLKRWFLREVVNKHFPKLYLSSEDTKKTYQYQRNLERNRLKQGLNIGDFIKSLEIKLKVSRNEISLQPRLAQLTQKTNQFNLTSRRYVEEEIKSFMKNHKIEVYGLEYADRYGNEGITGVAIVKHENKNIILDSFLLSCRIIGRNVEYAFLWAILNKLKYAKGRNLSAEFIPTEKNSVIKGFLASCGLKEERVNHYCGSVDKLKKKLKKCFPQK